MRGEVADRLPENMIGKRRVASESLDQLEQRRIERSAFEDSDFDDEQVAGVEVEQQREDAACEPTTIDLDVLRVKSECFLKDYS